jgi:hypothetical protein
LISLNTPGGFSMAVTTTANRTTAKRGMNAGALVGKWVPLEERYFMALGEIVGKTLYGTYGANGDLKLIRFGRTGDEVAVAKFYKLISNLGAAIH